MEVITDGPGTGKKTIVRSMLIAVVRLGIAEETAEIFVGVEEGDVRVEKGEEFLSGIQERGELFRAEREGLIGWYALCHVVPAHEAGGRKNAVGDGESCSLQ